MSYTPALPTISDTIWTDNFGFYYIRQDQINASGSLITTWFDAATGAAANPSATLTPIGSGSNLTVIRDLFDVVVNGLFNIFSLGDVLLRITVYDPAKTTTSIVAWVNLTKANLVVTGYWPSAKYVVSRDSQIVRARTMASNSIIISSITETAIAPAVSGLYTDIRSVVVANTSATAVRVDIRDAATATIIAGTGGVLSSTLAVTAVSSLVTNTLLGSQIAAGGFIVGQAYTIASAGSTSFTSIGSANNTVGTTFTATGVGTGTGTATANNIVPGMILTGSGVTAGATILPYGTNSTTGLGGTGTYAISLASTITAGTTLTCTKPVVLTVMMPPSDTRQVAFSIDAKMLQTNNSATWTATLASAVTDVRITAIANPIYY